MYDDNPINPAEPAATGYNPTKVERTARRRVYDRYFYIRADVNRINAVTDWEEGDKMFGQDIPIPDSDDWRSHLVLPDGFSSIQAHMQETIDRNSRPYLRRVQDSDQVIETYQNSILKYNLNRTNFDFQRFLAAYSASIRGTAYLVENYRVDKRQIQDPTDINPDGTLKYTTKEVIDYDDSWTEWVPNEFIFIDEAATHIDYARDYIRREVMNIDEFHRVYNLRADCKNVDLVRMGGETTTKSFFQMPKDLTARDVEVLHYYNRATDDYIICANNITIRTGPIPFKHKELNVTPIFHYSVPGRMFGFGVPKVIKAISAERAAIRNINIDRQKMQLNQMFLINDQADFDEDELVTRPHGAVEISTNGLSIRDVVMPLEYGDTPASFFRTDEMMKEDTRRATGIDDRIEGVQTGGTATEASFLRESSQKRINMIAKILEMDAIKRIGKLKWSNIQFFYPAPRIEKIMEDEDQKEKKVYRRVNVDGQEFTVVVDPETKAKSLQVNEIEGSSSFKLDKTMATFMEGDTEIVVDVESASLISRPLQQAKITEMTQLILSNPITAAVVDARKVVTQLTLVNQEQPKNWLQGDGKTDAQWQEEAEMENEVMKTGQPLAPTEGATEIHTLEHLHFIKSAEYTDLVKNNSMIEQIFLAHITGEHDNNPATGSSAEAMGGPVSAGAPPGAGGPAGMPGPAPAPGSAQVQPADLTPSTVTGQTPNAATSNAPLLR